MSTGDPVWDHVIASPAENYTATAADWLKWGLNAARTADRIEADVKALSAAVQPRSDGGGTSVDPAAVAAALAANTAFVDAIATAVAAKVGMIPTAGEIAKAVGGLTWSGKAA